MTAASTTVLITGINGFVGQHLAQYLLSQNIRVVGIGRRDHPAGCSPWRYERCDVLDAARTEKLFEQYSLDYVIHLVAENSVAVAWDNPVTVMSSNFLGTLNVLEAIRSNQQKQLKGVLVVGSSHEYGTPNQSSSAPLSENVSSLPTNPYGWSKRLQTELVQMYAQLYHLPVVVGRTFNLIGPGRSKGVCNQIAEQVTAIERGAHAPNILLGNIQVRRDFLDVRDAVQAYWTLVQMGSTSPGEIYNVCSGTAVSIESLLLIFQRLCFASFCVQSDASGIRKDDAPVMLGNNEKLCLATGWKPTLSLETSLKDMLDFYRQKDD